MRSGSIAAMACSLERGVRCRMSGWRGAGFRSLLSRRPGPHPTLLMRQPYGRDIASTVVYAHPVWFASHGYNVVIQDVRGRGDSEGEFYPFRHEARRWRRDDPLAAARALNRMGGWDVWILLPGHDTATRCRRAAQRARLHSSGNDGCTISITAGFINKAPCVWLRRWVGDCRC